jgi:hypothetical protein
MSWEKALLYAFDFALSARETPGSRLNSESLRELSIDIHVAVYGFQFG